MAKKPAKEEASISLVKYGEQAMTRYGTQTLKHRAIPSLSDGLKPVQRRILWSMYQLGLKPTSKATKAAKIVGHCFAAGTPVMTPTGEVPIEDLKIGDKVYTSRGEHEVVQTYANPPADMAFLILEDGRRVCLTLNQEVKIEVDGKFFWKKASLLTDRDNIVIYDDGLDQS